MSASADRRLLNGGGEAAPVCSFVQRAMARATETFDFGSRDDNLQQLAAPGDKDVGIWQHFQLHGLGGKPHNFRLFAGGDVESRRHLAHLAGIVVACALLGALAVWTARHTVVGRRIGVFTSAYMRAFKLAFKVGLSSCVIAAIGGSFVPTGAFHIVSAGVTVIIVMEMGSVDRVVVKGFNRSVGTLVGAAEAVLAIRLAEWGRSTPAIVFASIFLVTVTNAAAQRLKPKHGYVYQSSNITFVFVFYGYFLDGVGAILVRIVSVFAAVGVAWLVDILWPLLWLDSMWFSVNNVVAGTEKVLRKTFAIIDFTFVHDEILAQDGTPETLTTTLWKDRLFQPETVVFFQMKKEDFTLGDLQAQLSQNAHGKRFANEEEMALLHAEAKNAWEDIQFTYWLVRRRPPHNYYLLFERLHAVYAQAVSLSHMAYSSLSMSGQAIWRSSRHNIETLREKLRSLEPPVLELLRLCHQERPYEVDQMVAEIAGLLEEAVQACEDTLHGVQICSKQDRWRFEAFLMTVELFIAEMSTYVRKLLENFGVRSEGHLSHEDIGQLSIQMDDTRVDELMDRLLRLSRHADL